MERQAAVSRADSIRKAPVEVALSRLLSAIGYHQPPVYYLPAFTLKDDFGKHVEVGGRFRLKDPSLKETGFWKWEDNPFVGTKPYQGLIVMLMMFNSTDLKNTNNSLYEYRDGDLVEQWYVARDIGAALGDYNPISPRKNHPDSFEQVPYLLGVNNGHVEFAYTGWYKNLVRDRITPEEVAWASELLGRLSDKQWADAFRAGGYEPAVANRFIAKLREKIDTGPRARLPRRRPPVTGAALMNISTAMSVPPQPANVTIELPHIVADGVAGDGPLDAAAGTAGKAIGAADHARRGRSPPAGAAPRPC